MKKDRDDDIEREIRTHLDLDAEERVGDGMSETDARYAARRAFGNVTRTQEDVRAVWTRRWVDELVQDVRYAVRTLRKSPGFTTVAVLTLALGIGATSAVYSVVHGVLLKRLPYRDPDRVVIIWENDMRRNRPRNVIASANFVEWRVRSRSLEHIGMTGPARLNVVLDGQPEEVAGAAASSDVFLALGVAPAIGRAFTPSEDEEGHDKVIILSHEFWRGRLRGRDDVIGLKLIANSEPRTVIGVMPPAFTIGGQRADFFVPYGWTMERLRSSPGRGLSAGVAHLRDGVTFGQAATEMKNIAAQLEQEFPRRNAGWSVTLVPIHEQTVDQIRPAILVLAAAVALVLLIACVNVANLLLARSAVRQRELGVRAALGARRARLVRQMLTESLTLGIAGGTAGLGLAFAFHRGLLALVADRFRCPGSITWRWTCRSSRSRSCWRSVPGCCSAWYHQSSPQET
jgi:putative ABC transport system permease protein